MKPQNSMWFTFHTVDWRNSAPNQQAWFSPIVTSGFFSQLVWHRFGAMSFVAAWVSLATFGRARTKAWHEQLKSSQPSVLMESGKDVTTNEIILWPSTYRKSSQLLEVFTRIDIYFAYVYIYTDMHTQLPSLQHHSKFPITDSWNTMAAMAPSRVQTKWISQHLAGCKYLAISLGEAWKIIQIVNH